MIHNSSFSSHHVSKGGDSSPPATHHILSGSRRENLPSPAFQLTRHNYPPEKRKATRFMVHGDIGCTYYTSHETAITSYIGRILNRNSKKCIIIETQMNDVSTHGFIILPFRLSELVPSLSEYSSKKSPIPSTT